MNKTRYEAFREALENLMGKKPDEGLGCHYDCGVEDCLGAHDRIYGAEPTEEEIEKIREHMRGVIIS